MRKQADCHPDRFNKSFGMCKSCYNKHLYRTKPEQAEKYKQRAKRYRLQDIATYKTKARKRHIRATYGLSLEDYDRMFAAQKGLCAICHRPSKSRNMHIDHCHTTGAIRGLLCGGCNGKLGWYEKYLTDIQQYLIGEDDT